jgi:hypothetical protein
MEIKHKLSAEQASHLAGLVAQIEAYERNALMERGKAAKSLAAAEESEREARFRRQLISDHIALIEINEHLQPSAKPYELVGDCLIGEAKEEN